MPKNTESEEAMEDVENIKRKDLIGALTTSQVWGVGAAILGVLAAAFAIGFSAATYRSDVQTEKNKAKHQVELEQHRIKRSMEITKLNKEIENSASKHISSIVRIKVLFPRSIESP